MKHIELIKSIHIKAEATAVYTHLADITKHPGLQPLVIETREIERTVTDDGHTVIHFFSVEQFNFLGFIPYQNKIRVKMTQIPEEHLLVQEVNSFPNITLISRTTFQPDATGTAVTETIEIVTPNFVAGYVQKTADAAHDVLMQNLKTRLETAQKQKP